MLKTALFFSALLFAACAGKPQPDTSAEVKLTTTEGDIVLRLDGRTPLHRDNFLKLVREGFYDSLLFHRVVKDFVIQAGDPNSRHALPGDSLGDGEAGDYTLPAEIAYPYLRHVRGALAAARQSDDTNPAHRSSSSQFYIVWGERCSNEEIDSLQQRVFEMTGGQFRLPDSVRRIYHDVGGIPYLDLRYTVFGEVIKGLDVVEKIQAEPTDSLERPLKDVRILHATILREPEQMENGKLSTNDEVRSTNDDKIRTS